MKYFILLGLVLIPFITKAQFTKGDMVLNLGASFTNQKGYDQQTAPSYLNFDRVSLSINTKFGHFIHENLAFGGLLEGNIDMYKFAYNGNKDAYLSGSAGVFIQRYFTMSENFLFSIEAQSKFTRGYNSIDYYNPLIGDIDTQQSNYYALSLSAFPTFTFLPKPNWGIHASIGSISHTFTKSLSIDDTANETKLDFGSFSFGISYFFRD
ncbi:MAG: hypothetical protein O9302_08455 [Cyclobacteriaceae bacterium]|jgi:hypothetical protein|nr:hypothetical protein [Cytophagales bacterium]MCZ8328077.1 hypothetical protein [Cyclobacteriaceae bacterium]